MQPREPRELDLRLADILDVSGDASSTYGRCWNLGE